MRLLKGLLTVIVVGIGLVAIWSGYSWAVSAGMIEGHSVEDVSVTSLDVAIFAAVVVAVLVLRALLGRYRRTHSGTTYWHDN